MTKLPVVALAEELDELLQTMFWVDAESKQKVERLTKPLSLALSIAVEALEQHDQLMNESEGVYGLHLNGNGADWDWLKNEWLDKHEEALSSIASLLPPTNP
ncbi:MAG: hypothetical protein PHH13_05700 [Candidatus Peribacteraceae bacterium]|nr:hypothetical protein [Candidatus Peribacteraceae bacterium]